MKLSKKTKKIILFALIAAVLISAGTFGGIHIAKDLKMRSLYADYDTCSEELDMIIEFLQHQYPNEKKQPVYLRVAGGKMLLDPNKGFLNLPDEIGRILRMLDEVCFASEDAKLCMITFHGSRIQFDIENGAYALVYSPDGEPTYLHETNEGFPIKVRHIEGDWYHVSRVG